MKVKNQMIALIIHVLSLSGDITISYVCYVKKEVVVLSIS